MNHSSAGGDAAFCALRFGALLRDRRRMARLTQQDVAEKLHVNPNTVKNWEYDRTKPDHDLIPPLLTSCIRPLRTVRLPRWRSVLSVTCVCLIRRTGRRWIK